MLECLLVQAEQAVDRAEHVLGVARGDGGAVLGAQPQRLVGGGQRLGVAALFPQEGGEAALDHASAGGDQRPGLRREPGHRLVHGGGRHDDRAGRGRRQVAAVA
jgi:hypothetical protein